jgi:hypothetical protein
MQNPVRISFLSACPQVESLMIIGGYFISVWGHTEIKL